MDALNSGNPELLFTTYRDQLQLLNLVVINEDSLKQDKSAELQEEFLERFLAKDERLLKNLKDFINDESTPKDRILEVLTRCMQLIQRQNQKEQEKIREENERTKSQLQHLKIENERMDKQLQALTESQRDELNKTNERLDSLSYLVNGFLGEKRRVEMM